MRSDDQSMLLFFFGMAALYWSVVAAEGWVLRRRLPRTACGLAAVSAAIALAALASAPPGYSATDYTGPGYTTPTYSPPGYDSPRDVALEQERVEAMRQEFPPVLEAYRKAHGKYPNSLKEAGIKRPETRYGPLYYYGSRDTRPSWYLLSFGNPGAGGFSVEWDSRKQAWSVVEFDY